MRHHFPKRAPKLAPKLAAILALGVMVMISTISAGAVEPDEILDDPALEARARAISRQLRCVVCQSESIDDSNAPLAKDLRLLVRERLQAGDDNAAVMGYVTARYGDYVLLKPRLTAGTAFLWSAPVLFLCLAGGGAIVALRRRGRLMGDAKNGATKPGGDVDSDPNAIDQSDDGHFSAHEKAVLRKMMSE